MRCFDSPLLWSGDGLRPLWRQPREYCRIASTQPGKTTKSTPSGDRPWSGVSCRWRDRTGSHWVNVEVINAVDPNLLPGDSILIQDKATEAWSKSGTIVKIRPYCQYAVRIDRNYRLSLHNHSHLKEASALDPPVSPAQQMSPDRGLARYG